MSKKTIYALIMLFFVTTASAFASTDLPMPITTDNFIAHYTDNGVLYHGTSIANYRGMLTNGIKFSSLGSFGFFTTPQYIYARPHGLDRNGSNGVVLPFELRHDTKDLKALVNGTREHLSPHQAAELGYDVFIDPLPANAVFSSTEGTNVVLLNLAKFQIPSPLKSFESAYQHLDQSSGLNAQAAQLLALEKIYNLIPDGEKPKLQDSLVSAIAAAKQRLRPIRRFSISSCDEALSTKKSSH